MKVNQKLIKSDRVKCLSLWLELRRMYTWKKKVNPLRLTHTTFLVFEILVHVKTKKKNLVKDTKSRDHYCDLKLKESTVSFIPSTGTSLLPPIHPRTCIFGSDLLNWEVLHFHSLSVCSGRHEGKPRTKNSTHLSHLFLSNVLEGCIH